jgi:nucleotide-binding universal stress UspA family protein
MAANLHRMLYATDFSAASKDAIQYAIDYAVEKNATLIVFHVVNQRSITFSKILATLYNEGDEYNIRKEKVDIALKRMETLLGIYPQKELNNPLEHINRIEYLVVHYGKVAEEIVQKAHQWGCEMIILGPRRKWFLGRIFLPSVSRMVRCRSNASVHIIKKPKGLSLKFQSLNEYFF